jgi:hypothetical protein
VVESTVSFAGAVGITSDKPMKFFLERYAEACGGSGFLDSGIS